MDLRNEIKRLEPLCEKLCHAKNIYEKLEILGDEKDVRAFLCTHPLVELLVNIDPVYDVAIRSVVAIGQGNQLFSSKTIDRHAWHHLCHTLREVEHFYDTMGGIVGYHLKVLKLLLHEDEACQQKIYKRAPGLDISRAKNVRREILAGIKEMPHLAEIYPVGGAGDRLNLRDETTQEPLPAARLLFLGRSLLKGLIRDLQGREYLHYKLFGKQCLTPIALMTSHEKNNHNHILEICQEHRWFGRPPASFFTMIQPLAPVVTKEGEWVMTKELTPMLKPGGHGALWKLAENSGLFTWLAKKKRKFALVRQINNPIAGTDHGLLALAGAGALGKKAFGFASCPRAVNASEGMNVLVEEHSSYRISNVEYTAFAKCGIKDTPVSPGSPFSRFPANTNILFANLKELRKVVQKSPLPGMHLNMKQKVLMGKKEIEAGRLESTMQNIADFFIDHDKKNLKTFITYNERPKTISVTKCSYEPGKSIQETPAGCLYDLLHNSCTLLRLCKTKTPEMPSEKDYIKNGPSFFFLYHPALGPLYEVIAQKIRGGKLFTGADLQLEIAELDMKNLALDGSLLIQADSIMGKLDAQGLLRYGEQTGKCSLHNVKVVNAGIDRKAKNCFWKNQILYKERLSILLRGNAEFHAENITFSGPYQIEVQDGYRMTAVAGKDGTPEFLIERLKKKPSWHFSYTADKDGKILLNCL